MARFFPDRTERVGHGWKLRHVRPLAEVALAEGRTVMWIEDFDGDLPDLEGIVYVDTGERGVLRRSDVPFDALGNGGPSSARPMITE